MKKATELIFIPIPGIGHIVSTVEIAKLLLSRDDNLFITILIMKFPFHADGTDDYIESLADPSSTLKTQRVKFVNLPQEQFQGHGATGFFTFIDSHKSHVKDAVTKITESGSATRIAGFVIDMFRTGMIDVRMNSDFLPMCSTPLVRPYLGSCSTSKPFVMNRTRTAPTSRTSDAELVVPNFVNPLPAARVLPGVLFEKEASNFFLNFAERYRETKGILVNTFMELESYALQYLSADGKVPPVFPVGPILNVKSHDDKVGSEKLNQKSDILKWLDDQPPLSVVFLCFGSMGSIGEDQMKQIAYTLEQGGFRFLWSLRQPPEEEAIFPSDYADYSTILPEGFLDRDGWDWEVSGMVCQLATWPFYVEQQVNAFELVNELKLAVEIDIGYRKDSGVVVSSQDIKKGIKEVMEQDSELRKRVKEMSHMSKKALVDDGSSYSSLGRFIDQIQSSS
ncbi:hypothetical protein M0R45_032602 [Rubus argutus]|uniref:Uncharacterized protein n=1 Tax=Rubus argutus TaxID=59490 RepID=A0AAW1WJS9_RUBAR